MTSHRLTRSPNAHELLAFDIDRNGRLDEGERALQRRVTPIETGRVLNDRYVLVGLLGCGGQAETYLALDTKDNRRHVAVKILKMEVAADWKSVELFEREASILERLKHPQIPGYVDHFHIAADGIVRFASVQRFVHGEDLGRRLAGGNRWSTQEAVRRIDEVTSVLAYLHSLSPPVVHRDIKPSNVILGEDDQLYLVDFGAAQDIVPATAGGSTIIGTTGYVPIEQYMGQAVPASDIYALGATALHMVTGVHPADFPVVRSSPDFGRQIPGGPLAEMLGRMLAPHAEDRVLVADQRIAVHRTKRQPRRDIDTARPWLGVACHADAVVRSVQGLHVVTRRNHLRFTTHQQGVRKLVASMILVWGALAVLLGLEGALFGWMVGLVCAFVVIFVSRYRFEMGPGEVRMGAHRLPLASVTGFEPMGPHGVRARLQTNEVITVQTGWMRTDARDYFLAVLNDARECFANRRDPTEEVW